MDNSQIFKSQEIIDKEIQEGKIKLCPKCTIYTEKINGCNYLKCTKCQTEWCWLCHKIKYTQCNDKSHNSH
jgi:IBR domain